MSRLLTNRRLFVLLASFIILLIIAGLTLRGGGLFSLPEQVLLDVDSSVSSIIYPPISKVTGFISGVRQLHEMYVENSQLKSQLVQYERLKAQLRTDSETIGELRTMLHFRHEVQSKYTMVAADVVGRDPSTWNSEVIIDVGKADNVKAGMAVIGPDGSLIGKIILAGQLSSKVALITDAQQGDGVSALVQTKRGTPPFGIVVGSSSYSGYLEMGFLSPLADVQVGDPVVTSGLSTQFPKGLLIGTITKIGQSSGGVTQYAIIRPSADMNYLEHCFVVQSGGTGP